MRITRKMMRECIKIVPNWKEYLTTKEINILTKA